MLLHETVTLTWLQGRRLSCASCTRTFTVLASGEVTGRALHVPRLPAPRRSDPARAHALSAVRSAASAGRQGRGRCPSCGRHQRWMRRSSSGEVAIVASWLLVAAVIMTTLTAIGGAPALAMGIPVSLLLGGIGLLHADRYRAIQRGKDPLAKTDAELDDLVLASLAQGRDPWTAWAQEAHLPLTRGVVSAGFRDETGERFALPLDDLDVALARLEPRELDLLAPIPASQHVVRGAPVTASPFKDARLMDVK